MPDDGTRRSVALRYDESLPAPMIVAKGRGHQAERLDRLARDAGVPIVSDGAIVAGLEPLDIGEFVPPEYWELVARVLAFIRNVRL